MISPDALTDSPQSGETALYARLREDLVRGKLDPGTKLKPKLLVADYPASTAALREVLLRLAAEGFVTSQPQRGFRVVTPTPSSIWEIAHFRILLEKEGARLSIIKGDVGWEANLTAAHHRLSHLEARMRGAADLSDQLRLWSRYDRDFHEALIGACGSALLKAQHRAAFDRFKQHVITQDASLGFRGEALIEEHDAILTSALARDAAACNAAIQRHFETYRRFTDHVME